MMTWQVFWKKVNGGKNLKLRRRFFGIWQDVMYFNNDVHRSEEAMNKLVEKFQKEYDKHSKLVKERARICEQITNSTSEDEGRGVTTSKQLPFWRNDKRELPQPPETWRSFAMVLKHGGKGVSTASPIQVASLDDNIVAGSDYPIKVTNDNQNRKQQNRQRQQNQQQNQHNQQK